MPIFPNIILYNGKIYTMSNESEHAEAIAIAEGKIVATGRNEDLLSLSDANTAKIDLRGRAVLPGLIDTHTHLETVAKGLLTVNLKKAKSINDVLKMIKKNIPKEPDKWIVSSWWHPFSQLREKRVPTRFEIDKVCPNNPVILFTVGHIAITNSRALEIAGINESSPDPEGGKIERNSLTGHPTGVLYESAIGLVEKLCPSPNQEKLLSKFKEAMKTYNKVGLTSIVTGGTTPEEFKIWQKLWSKKQMTLRVNVSYLPTGEYIPLEKEEQFDLVLNELKISTSVKDHWLSLGCIKFVLDGGMTLKTAAVTEPYQGEPEDYGMMTMDQDRLNALVGICNKHHWRVGIHAVGDRAIDTVLDGYERANKQSSIEGRRFILIHGFLIRSDQIDRARKLALVVATQNVFMYEKARPVERFLGKDRACRSIPTRSMINGRLTVTGGSDADVNSFNPFLGIYQAVTRKSQEGKEFGINERISRCEAVFMYTKWAAMQTFDEQIKGVLKPGRLADLIVTSPDIFACAEDEIKDISVLMTIVGGKIVYASHDIFV
jgi:predicted amidohydrolase YtcJ